MSPVPTDPFACLSTRQLETELLGVAGHIAAAQCRFLRLLAEFDRRGGWAGPGLKSLRTLVELADRNEPAHRRRARPGGPRPHRPAEGR